MEKIGNVEKGNTTLTHISFFLNSVKERKGDDTKMAQNLANKQETKRKKKRILLSKRNRKLIIRRSKEKKDGN